MEYRQPLGYDQTLARTRPCTFACSNSPPRTIFISTPARCRSTSWTHFRSFAHQVVPKLVQQGIAVLAMKSMGDGNVLKNGTVTPIECLHYALNLPVSVVITGCESMERVDQAVEAARTFDRVASGRKAAGFRRTSISGYGNSSLHLPTVM
jgi:hypothetical protein